MIQIVLVILLAVVAVFFLVRRFYRTTVGKQKPGCEKCAANPTHH